MKSLDRPSRTISSRSLHGQVAQEIGRRIVRGELRPGETLPNESSRFGAVSVSRTAYREAVKVLSAKGLVDARPKAGTRVRPREHWNLLDPDVLAWHFGGGQAAADPAFLRALFEVRMMFEPTAAAMAAVRRTPEHLRRIEEAFQGMRGAEPESEAVFTTDLQFHQAILDATGNDVMVSFGAMIETALLGSFRLTRNAPGDFVRDHGAVLEAIAYQKPAEARAAMRKLVQDAMRRVSEVYGPRADDWEAIGF